MTASSHPSALLADFAVSLRHDSIPDEVLRRTEELMLECLAIILAGSSARGVRAIANYADAMGPTSGPSENFVSGRSTSPVFAAMVNAAAAHMIEQPQARNGPTFHSAAVIFPPAIAVAQALGRSGPELLTATVAGWEVCMRVDEFLNQSHYGDFDRFGIAGALGAAAAVGNLLRLDSEQMLSAFGSAGTQSGGLWALVKKSAESQQLCAARAAVDGLMAAWLANESFADNQHRFADSQMMEAGMYSDAHSAKLMDALGSRWTVLEAEVSYPTRPEIEEKAMRLGTYRNAADPDSVRRLIAQVWALPETERVQHFIDAQA